VSTGAVVSSGFLTFPKPSAAPIIFLASNDVVQSSITVFRKVGTNETRATVKWAFTDTFAKRLEEFYRAHIVGQEVRWQIGRFAHVFKLDDRKDFGRDEFNELTEPEAEALEAGLRGER
jgi:hypothetical protein